MKKLAMLFIVLISVTLIAGCVQQDQYYCETDDDCLATCCCDCVSKEYMKGKYDCLAVIDFACKCVNNACQRVPLY